MGTLYQIGDVLLEESFRAWTDETSRRLVCHAAHADADLHAAGYVARRVHQRAQRARQGTFQRALGRSTRARTRQAEIQRGIAVVAGAVAATETARVARVIVVVMLTGLHRRLQIRRQAGGQTRRQIRRHHVVLLRVRRCHHAAHLVSQTCRTSKIRVERSESSDRVN